jgi:AraC-like DNA-binding protein
MRKKEFVESYIDAWNHRDSKGVVAHLSADGTYCDIPENVEISSDRLITFLDGFFAEYRHRYELIGEIHKSENSVAFQYRMFLAGNEKKNAMTVVYHGAEFITLNGDAAVVITDYYDIPVKTSSNKYAKSGLTSDQMHVYKQRLDQIMQSRKEYLRPDLTLPRLAESVGCSVNNLSQVINSGFGTSFFDYLNRYRIEHARKLLENSDTQSSAILTIAFTVGCNSNSAFYSAFKKYVGMTPAQYRQAYEKSHH